jgi:hypothetical protein
MYVTGTDMNRPHGITGAGMVRRGNVLAAFYVFGCSLGQIAEIAVIGLRIQPHQ